ncbi:MAG: polymer-forming cytoskeletal protein [Bradymonadia bacterium]
MANTVIGSSIVIDGEMTSSETLVVQGTIKGKVQTSEGVFIENSARVDADVEAENVEIGGELTGNVSAGGRVEIKAEGKMVGDVRSPRILIADGALFKGNIDMDVER